MRITLRRRSGVSSIVAEITLIAVVLIATVIFASFTFGVFSFYYSPPEVAVEGASCSTAGNSTTCQLTLSNMGNRDTSTTGSCSLNVGTAVSGLVVNGGIVPAGGSLTNVQCVTHGVDPSPGSQVTGALSLTNGGIAFFVGSVG
jgi:FlaG/FlaF family flagellin (archaellin)